MKKLVLGYLILCILSSDHCLGQSRCVPDKFYKTDSLGNDEDKMAGEMNFIFSDDSVNIYLRDNYSIPILAFKILGRDCKWDKDSISGSISFRLFVNDGIKDKSPTLNIVFINNIPFRIELLYDNSERRLFTIIHKAR